jgi:hypothetical protein
MKPTYDELADALRVMTYAYDADTVRDGLKYIGLGHKSSFPLMRRHSKITNTDEARGVLLDLERDLGNNLAANRLADEMSRTP